MEILEKPEVYGASPGVLGAIVAAIEDKMLKADKVLADTAIAEAEAGDAGLLAEAAAELENAAAAKASGEYDKAVGNYFKAWEAALKASGDI